MADIDTALGEETRDKFRAEFGQAGGSRVFASNIPLKTDQGHATQSRVQI
jgi:hypothetical protein